MRYPIRASTDGPRRGVALIAVLMVVAILALAAYRFNDLMQAESLAGDSFTRSVQARAAADSGLSYTGALLANDPTGQNILNGTPYDNPTMFQGQLLQDGGSPRQRFRFSVVSPADPDTALAGGAQFRYGVTDEAGKININALFKLDSSGQTLYNTLMQLPNMTDDVANSIVYWIDPNATPRSSGATDEYYMSQSPPYHAKNAPLDSIEELLYVRGVTPQLLFGNDKNRNGQLDPDEADGSGALDLGWFPYLTMYSRELNVDSQGNPRIWVNDPDLQSLQTYLTNAGFDDTITSFIIAYRMYGPAGGNTSGGGGSGAAAGGAGSPTVSSVSKTTGGSPGVTAVPKTTGGSPGVTAVPKTTGGTGAMGGGAASAGAGSAGAGSGAVSNQRVSRGTLGNVQSQGGGQTISSLYSLINAQVSIPASTPGGRATTYNSPMSDAGSIAQYLPQILDQLTTSKAANLPARVNVNTAPSTVLSALSTGSTSGSTPILDPGTVQTILATRPQFTATGAPDQTFQTPAWLITQANVPVATMKQLDQYITARSQVYRVQSVGHFDGGGATARVEAVIDLNAGRPRIVYYRDLTSLGKGFDLPKNP